MTFNLLTPHLYCFGQNSFSLRKQAVLSLFYEENPDLIGIQELTRISEKKLSPLHQIYGMTGQYRYGYRTPFNESCAVLYRRSRFHLLKSRTYWLSDQPDIPSSRLALSVFPRTAVFAVLKDRITGRVFTMINVHLDHGLESVRTRQSKILSALIAKHAMGDSTVITGDFNTDPGSDAIRILAESGFRDLADNSLGSTLRGRFGTRSHQNLPIDHILVSKGVSCQRIQVLRRSYQGIYPSDHWPVQAILEE